MTKILLVEDDKSLREIYGVRLLAEGYDIVSAGDGEEALAIAIKERPQLILSDVMMPKISGFDMLDILRSTTETKDTKVIIMTALSSEEQRQRGESLGADLYLVKSQVGIEDVIRAVKEVLAGKTMNPVTQPAPPAQSPTPQPAPQPMPAPTPMPQPSAAPQPAPQPAPPTPSQPPVPPAPTPTSTKMSSSTEKVIQPIPTDNNEEYDVAGAIDAALKEQEKMTAPVPNPMLTPQSTPQTAPPVQSPTPQPTPMPEPQPTPQPSATQQPTPQPAPANPSQPPVPPEPTV